MKKLLIAAAVAAGMSSTAFAADLDTEVVDPVFGWGGFYAGVVIGYGHGDYEQFSASGVGVDVDVDGVTFGGTLGYNIQSGNLVYGVELDYQSGFDGTTAQGTAGPFWSCNSGVCNVDIESFGTLRARLGFAQDNFLIYATGGLAFAQVDGGILNSVQQGGGSEVGYTIGGGVEYAFDSNWSAKLEYLHVDLGDIEFGTGIGTETFEGDGDFGIVRFGINYRF